MRYEIRPIGNWTDPVTAGRWPAHRFKASWSATLDLLRHETDVLGAELVIIQIDAREYDIRRDGMLRADAKVGRFPGVRVSFDSIYGPLTYSTDRYEDGYYGNLKGWHANIRAIALSLEALRAVDRYGVSRRGEQYSGWTAIAARPAEMTPDQAAEFLASWAYPSHTPDQLHVAAVAIRRDSAALTGAYREAAKRAHPDVTHDDGDTMARLNTARDLLNGSRT